MLGFSKFDAEWKTTELAAESILIDYTYWLHSDVLLLYPLNWLFAKLFWRVYMKRVLNNIKQLAYKKEPYIYH